MSNYLYNGIELPALPEWDKAAYPYAYISYSGTYDAYFLRLVDAPGVHQYYMGQECIYFGTDANLSNYKFVDGAWTFYNETTAKYEMIMVASVIQIVWSNYNILNKDGTIYLSASDPIPVGGEPIDPQAYIVGRRLVGMRK